MTEEYSSCSVISDIDLGRQELRVGINGGSRLYTIVLVEVAGLYSIDGGKGGGGGGTNLHVEG